MTEIIGILQPGEPDAPVPEKFEAMGYDLGRVDDDEQTLFFALSDSEFPVLPITVTEPLIEDDPRFGLKIRVECPVRIPTSPVPAPSDPQDLFRYRIDRTNYFGASLDVRFGRAPELGSPQRATLLRACADAALKLATPRGRIGEGRDLELISHGDPRNLQPNGPSLSELIDYYEQGTEMKPNYGDILAPLFPYQMYTAIRNGSVFSHLGVAVVDSMNTGGSIGGPRTDMGIALPAYAPDAAGERGAAVDTIGVQQMKLSVEGEPVIEPEPSKVDLSGGGRMDVTATFAPVAAALAFRLSDLTRSLQ